MVKRLCTSSTTDVLTRQHLRSASRRLLVIPRYRLSTMTVGPFCDWPNGLELSLSLSLSRTIYVTRSLAETASVAFWKRFCFRHTSAFSTLGVLCGRGCALQTDNLLTDLLTYSSQVTYAWSGDSVDALASGVKRHVGIDGRSWRITVWQPGSQVQHGKLTSVCSVNQNLQQQQQHVLLVKMRCTLASRNKTKCTFVVSSWHLDPVSEALRLTRAVKTITYIPSTCRLLVHSERKLPY